MMVILLFKYYCGVNTIAITMRKYLLTDHERDMIQKYLDSGVKINGFAVLKHNISRNIDKITDDFELMKKLLAKNT